MTDFTIKTCTGSISCHKLILGAQAKYFELMFEHDDTSECDFSDILEPNALQVVTDYFYTGKIRIEFNDAMFVIQVLDYLQVNDDILKDTLFDYVDNNLNNALHARNCVEWYMFGDQMDRADIKRVTYNKMMMDYGRVVLGNAVLMLSFDQFTSYMHDIIQAFDANRDELLWVASRWINFDAKARREKFTDIAAIIDLSKCSEQAITAYSPRVAPHIIRRIFHQIEEVLANFYDLE